MQDEFDYVENENSSDDHDDLEQIDEYETGRMQLPWWIRKSPSLLISVGIHFIIIGVCAYMTFMYLPVQEVQAEVILRQGTPFEPYEEDSKPDIDTVINVKDIIYDNDIPYVVLNEDTPVTDDIPKGINDQCQSDVNTGGQFHCNEYGIGPGKSGPYGDPDGRGRRRRSKGPGPTTKATLAALKWLKRHQDRDGSWDGDGYSKHCGKVKSGSCDGKGAEHFDVGLTGLALLAYLGEGHTHRSSRYFKRVVKKGLWNLKDRQKSNGQYGDDSCESWIYNHSIATMAMAEAYAITGDFRLKKSVTDAVQYILDAQNNGTGWRYEPRSGQSDTSVTGWMVLALKAARVGGIDVPDTAFDGALVHFDRMTNDRGRTGYIRCGDTGGRLRGQTKRFDRQETMTGVALICRIFSGQDKKSKSIKRGARLLMSKLPTYDLPEMRKVNFYYWYNATYAMFQLGGKDWKKWNAAMVKALIPNQRGDTDHCTWGSWDPVGEWCGIGGRVYATAINALTLEIYYRFARIEKSKK